MSRITATFLLLLFGLLNTSMASAATITSNAVTGTWNAAGTWAGGVIPGASDDVIIANGATVTLDVSTTCASLTVGQGASGILQFESTTAQTLTVNGNVTITVGGTFRSNLAGTVTTHLLSLSGNLTNNGTLDFSTNSNTAGAGITFTGATSNTFGGTGGPTDIFGPLTINKGTSAANVLELNPSVFTFKGASSATAITPAYLTLLNGTFKISGTFTMNNGLYLATTAPTIEATAGLWLNNPNYTISGRNHTTTLSGALRVDNGNLTVGTASGNSLQYTTGSAMTITGGTTNVAGRFAGTTDTQTTTYAQTAGILSVCRSGNASSSLASFDLPTAGSSFTMSGGLIELRFNSSAGTPLDYRNAATVSSISGGTLQLGSPTSISAREYRISGHVPNLVLTNAPAPHSARLIGTLDVWLNATLNTGTTLIMNTTAPVGQVWQHHGGTITNNGTIVGDVSGSRLAFIGNGVAQSYTGTGTCGTGAAPLATLEIDNPLGVTLSQATNMIAARCNLLRGALTGSNKLDLGVGGASAATTQVGFTGSTSPGGSYDVSPVFNIGSGGYTLLYHQESVPRTTGFEIPGTRTAATLTVDNTNNVTLDGGDLSVTGTTTLTNGVVSTGSNKLIIPASGTVARTNGHVNGNLQKNVATGTPTRSFEIGDATNYAPVTTAFTAVSAAGDLTARTDAGDLVSPAGSGLDYSKSVNRNYTLSATGGLTFGSCNGVFNFVSGDVDGPATPANFVVRKLDGSTWTPTTTVGVPTATSIEASWTTGFSQFAIGELVACASTITASAGVGGSISPPGATVVTCGDDETYTITAAACYSILDVLVDGLSVGAVGTYTFTDVAANHTIDASFVAGAVTITATAGAGGTITPPGVTNVTCGGSQNYLITASPGFAILDVLVDNVSVGPVSSYLFSAVAVNHTIHATFVDIECPVVQVTSPNGGEILVITFTANLTWTATDNVGVTCVDLLLSVTGAGGPYTPIATCVPNTGTYAWVVAPPISMDAFIKVVAHDAAGNACEDVSDSMFQIIYYNTSATGEEPVTAFALSPVGPNPTRGPAQIQFAVPHEARVRVVVMDVLGRQIATLVDETVQSGRHQATWSGESSTGPAPNGLYFILLEAPGTKLVRRVVVVR